LVNECLLNLVVYAFATKTFPDAFNIHKAFVLMEFSYSNVIGHTGAYHEAKF